MSKLTKAIAHAIAAVNPAAGMVTGSESIDERAANLLKEQGCWGAYVREADEQEYGKGVLAIVSCESAGIEGDCGVPFNYNRGWDLPQNASSMLCDRGHLVFLEWQNPAVLYVYEA